MALVMVRGGGDIATGTVQKLWRSGFAVVVAEIAKPLTIRRTVSLSEAMLAGETVVEDLHGVKTKSNKKEIYTLIEKGSIPVLDDPACESLSFLKPDFLIDAIIAKRNLGTHRQMAPVTVGLGPGFSAPEDVDAVVETLRGHILGQLILKGQALADTGVPGLLGGKDKERVVHAPCGGTVAHQRAIGDEVAQGDTLFMIDQTPVLSPLDGVLRGLIADGMVVKTGLKCADVDPRSTDDVDYRTISDKARCIGGAVLEACLMLGHKKGLLAKW